MRAVIRGLLVLLVLGGVAQAQGTGPFGPATPAGLSTTNPTYSGALSSTQTEAGTSTSSLINLLKTITAAPGGNDFGAALLTYNFNFGNGPLVGYDGINVTSTVNGDGSANGPGGNVYPLSSYLYENALRSTVSSATTSQDANVYSYILKTAPAGGIPAGRKMRDGWNWWSQFVGPNLPSSQSGADIIDEHDFASNGVDDINTRVFEQSVFNLALPLASGGYPFSFNAARYISAGSGAADVWAHDWDDYGGQFNHAAIDLGYTGSGYSTITSSTPGSPVYSVTVDNVMPLESGGSSGGVDFPVSSTAAKIIATTAATTAGTTLTLANTNYLATGMFVLDITSNGITFGPTIASISGNTVTLSSPVTVASGDNILFSPGTKHAAMNGTNYVVAGIVLSGAGTHAGTVYFTTSVTVANATNGVVIYPNSHEIWLCSGSATAPWCDIALDRNGGATLRSDGNGGATLTGNGLQVLGNNGALYPQGTSIGLSIGGNFTGNQGEVDFWNTYNSLGTVFNWYEKTGTSSNTLLASLGSKGDFAVPGGYTQAIDYTHAAAGTTQGTATALTNPSSYIGSGTGGVLMRPCAAIGAQEEVYNETGAAITVYPSSGYHFNNDSANVGASLANATALLLRCVSANGVAAYYSGTMP